MSEILFNDPNILQICRNGTLESLKGKIDEEALNGLLSYMPSDAANDSRATAADASLVSAVIWSTVSCTPKNLPWKFEESAWGPGIGGGSCTGFLYHAYKDANDWDSFFHDAVAYHAQGIAATGGIFQINWFNSKGVPIGQFNGAMAGGGVFEIGNSCKWKHK